jgi:hypothetical protein
MAVGFLHIFKLGGERVAPAALAHHPQRVIAAVLVQIADQASSARIIKCTAGRKPEPSRTGKMR